MYYDLCFKPCLSVDSQFNAKVADLELGIIQRGLLKDRSTANHSVGSLPMHIDSSTSLWQAAKECLGFHTTDPNASRKPLMNIRPADDFLANWLPPELIVDPLCTYQASDVFSFGMVLWELVAKKIPFEDIKSQQMIRSKVRVVFCINAVV